MGDAAIIKCLYIEFSLICSGILFYIIMKMKTSHDNQTESIALMRVMISTIAILVLDALWAAVNGRGSTFFIFSNNIINALYLSDTGLIGYLWLEFVRCSLKKHSKKSFSSAFSIILLLPVAVLTVLCFASIWTGSIFDIDSANVYHRGPLHAVQVAVGLIYIIIATIYLLIAISREPQVQKRRDLLTMLSFAILPCIGIALNSIVMQISPWPFAAISLMMVYVNFMEHRISTDGLTGLNNRRQFDQHIQNVMNEFGHSKRMFLFLIDVDYFKRINDTYGHTEGDHALIRIAAVLRDAGKSKDLFLARYGGDEFAAIYKCSSESRAIALENEINDRLASICRYYSIKYKLSLSIGHQEYYSSRHLTPDLWIADADEALYKAKHFRHRSP